MQTRADVLGTAVEIVSQPDVTPRGAAMIAGVGVGFFADFWDAAKTWALDRSTIVPDDARAAIYEDLYTKVYRPLCEVVSPLHHILGDIPLSAVGHEGNVGSGAPN